MTYYALIEGEDELIYPSSGGGNLPPSTAVAAGQPLQKRHGSVVQRNSSAAVRLTSGLSRVHSAMSDVDTVLHEAEEYEYGRLGYVEEC